MSSFIWYLDESVCFDGNKNYSHHCYLELVLQMASNWAASFRNIMEKIMTKHKICI